MTFVLDASVTVAWCFADERGPYAESALESLRGSETASQAAQFVKLFLGLPIAIDPVSRGRALTTTHRLARTHGLTSYDASYLELAVREGLPLATLDSVLAVAAEREGVGHWRPE